MNLSPAARAVLARLAWSDAAAVAPCLLPGARSLLRNALIRAALQRFYGELSPTRAAQALAADLAGAATPGTVRGDAAAALIALNGGRQIAWRRIHDIAGEGPMQHSPLRKPR